MSSLSCARCVFYILNAFYFVLALELLVLGIWVAVDPSMKTVTANAQLPVGYLLIGIGVGMLVVAILAYISACKLSGCLLITSFVGFVLSLIALTAIIIWVAMARSTVKESVDVVLGDCVKEYVSSKGAVSVCSALLDTVQTIWSCCGRNGYTDYATSALGSLISQGSANIPKSCGDTQSNAVLQIASNIIQRGCSPAVQQSIEERYALILGVVGAQLIFPLILCILSMVMYRQLKTAGFSAVRT